MELLNGLLRRLNGLKINNLSFYSRLCHSSTATQPTGQPSRDLGSDHHQKLDQEEYDIVINGGGIVGLSLLLAIKKSPFLREKRTVLLERINKPTILKNELRTQNEERTLSNRVSSLTSSSRHFFQELNAWESMEPYSKQINAMHIWSSNYNKGITFHPSEGSSLLDLLLGSKPIDEWDTQKKSVCHILENQIILNSLLQEIKHLDVNTISYGVDVKDIKANDDGGLINLITLQDGREKMITCNLLIGSDGFNSFVRKKSNIVYKEVDLGQKAIVGTVEITRESEFDQNDIAYQRFIPWNSSVLALLPLTDNYSSFVLSTKKENEIKLSSLSDAEFVDTLNDYLFKQTSKNDSLSSNISSLIQKIDNLIPTPNSLAMPPPRISPPNILNLIPESRFTIIQCFQIY